MEQKILKIIRENILWLFLVIMVTGGCCYGVYHYALLAHDNYGDLKIKQEEVAQKQEELDTIQKSIQAREQNKKKQAESGKVIYEVLAQQFTPEASFGIMFENILSNISNSGIRIRSIDYNYKPMEDKLLDAQVQGYNGCELSFVAVGKYSQLQSFFKNIAKEKYLSNIQEIYIEPYDQDKSILIAKFKIRLYTKTI